MIDLGIQFQNPGTQLQSYTASQNKSNSHSSNSSKNDNDNDSDDNKPVKYIKDIALYMKSFDLHQISLYSKVL